MIRLNFFFDTFALNIVGQNNVAYREARRLNRRNLYSNIEKAAQLPEKKNLRPG